MTMILPFGVGPRPACQLHDGTARARGTTRRQVTEETRTMSYWRAAAAALAAFGALMGPITASAQNAIKSITSNQQSGTEVVRIELSAPLASVPNGFSVQAPPRIAIDLPGVTNGVGRNTIEINQGNLRSVSIAEATDRSRVVLVLKQASGYRAQLQGNALLVVLDVAGAATANAAPPTQFAPAQNVASESLRDIDFRRGADGAGRVIVTLPNTQVGVDISQQGQSLVVEFPRSTLPDALHRKLDVTDFGTPVKTITTYQNGESVRMVVEPTGVWQYSAYQSDEQFVLEVRPTKIDPNKLTQGPGFNGEKLSLNFQNIEVRALLQVIADFTNFNVVTSDTVTGTVTLRLKDVPWDQALDIILQSKGLGVRKNGNVLWIAPKDELAAKEQQDLEAKKKVADLEPTRTQSFQLNYTKAADVAAQLLGQGGGGGSGGGGSGQANRILTSRGSVFAEQRTNQLFVNDIPSKLEEIQALVAKIDVPARQVLIEARIVEANDNFGRALGVKLGATDSRIANGGLPDTGISIGGNYQAIGAQTGQSAATTFTNSQFVSLPANVSGSAFGGAAAATIGLSLFSATANRFLNLELSALESEGNGKIVSSPRVITADQEEALIEQGTELPYQAATSSGATSVQFRKANLVLKVTPQITPEGNVILAVDVSKDSVSTISTVAGPAIDTKHVKTQVLVENGGTVVIGGIYTLNESSAVAKVPLLGDLPLVGVLFRNTVRSNAKTELLIFITPKIVTSRATAS
jgi:type IV pilus assembly protein PilQ